MIATLKVLGLKARDIGEVALAARRVVDYVHGPVARRSNGPAAMAAYYAGPGDSEPDGGVAGRVRGSAARLVGLHGEVRPAQLQRLLTGRHARTGRPLLPATGSAGRASRRNRPMSRMAAGFARPLTLEEAAGIAGVSAGYLRRLARENAVVAAAGQSAASGGITPAPDTFGRPPDHDMLRADQDATGRWLIPPEELARFIRDREPPTVVIGYDLTFSAPKSLSLLWAFGDDDLRADIAASFEAGVNAALAYLERHATVGTVGGRNRPGLGLAVAAYRHDISRAEDAHLHEHDIIANGVPVPVLDESGLPVLDADGVARVEWRALDGEVLLAHVKTAGYFGGAALRHDFTRRRGLRWGEVRNGVAELAAFPRSLLDAFSTRSGEVEDRFAKLVANGFDADAGTRMAAQRGSRATKRVLADAEVLAIQRRRLAEAGWTPAQVRDLAAPGEHVAQPPGEEEIAALFERLAGPRGLTEHQPLFDRRDVHRAVAAWSVDRLDPDTVSVLAERFLADSRVVVVQAAPRRRRNQPEPAYTTAELLQIEDNLVALYLQGRVDHGGLPRAITDPAVTEQAISDLDAELRQVDGQDGAGLAAEQADLVRAVLSSGDLVRPVVGPAGTGKTEAMRAVVRALRAGGHNVVGSAHGGRQAEDLRERLDIETRVVSGWLTLLDHAPDPGEAWPPGSVLIVDEATQVSTRDAERLLRYTTRTGTAVILVGDPAQLGSVGAGGWFRHLVALSPDTPGLATNQRQRGPELAEVRRALAGLRSHLPADTDQALHRLAADGRIRLFDTRDDLLAAAVDDWYADRQQRAATHRPAARMMAEHHADIDLLNHAARERLHADGTITGPGLRAAGRDFQAGDEVITLTQQDHTLIPAGKRRSAYIRTGTVGHVTAVHLDPQHPARQALTVRFPGKGDVHIPWDYLTHAFPDGRDGGLAHAYAITAHKAEGTTMPTARALVTDRTSRAGLYVMLSRARRDLLAYVIRRADLEADLDDEDWLPVLRDAAGPVRRLLDHLHQSRPERLASEHDPIAQAAHQLRLRRGLAELTALRRAATTPTDPPDGGSPSETLAVIRRAELAAEAAIASTAPTAPSAELVAHVGPRPPSGPDRATWDQAVAVLAIYHARRQPDAPPHELGPAPPAQSDAPEQRWHDQRRQATQLANRWAADLDPARARRFRTAADAIPRQRAIAGIHALLDHGRTPDALTAALSAREQDTARSGAAVLEHRVRGCLRRGRVDPTPYQLPPPRTARDEWNQAARRLRAARVNHLATRPTNELADDYRDLTRILTADPTGLEGLRRRLEAEHHRLGDQTRRSEAHLRAAQARLTSLQLDAKPDRAAINRAAADIDTCGQRTAASSHALQVVAERLAVLRPGTVTDADREIVRHQRELIDAALARQIDHAGAHLAAEPAAYLTALLGRRPTAPQPAAEWNRRALAIEHYRHYELGLAYGTPATDPPATPAEQALGQPPTEANARHRYERLQAHQATLGLAVG